MERLRVLLSRLLSLFRRRQLDDRLREEMATHLAMQAEENRRRGMTSGDAHYAALRAFGGVEQASEAHRDLRGFAWLDALLQDLRYARRTLVKSPGFVLTAVAVLALAVGANTALFTFFDGYVLKPIPIPDARSNFEVYAHVPRGDRPLWSYADYQEIRKGNGVFTDTYAYAGADIRALTPEPCGVHAMFVSGSYFAMLGGRTILGRPIALTDDEVPGRDAVMVLSHGGWQRLFGGDPLIVGKTVRVRQREFTVIGVADPQFSGTSPVLPDLWIPLAMRDEAVAGAGLTDPESRWLFVGGLLKPGMALPQAHDSFLGLVQGLNARHPASNTTREIWFYPRATYVPMRPDLLLLTVPVFVLFGLVLLIACADLANLLLAHAAARQREIAIRLALGASRARLIRQLLTESLLLSMAGTAAGYLLARGAVDAIHAYLFSVYTKLGYGFQPLTVDWRIFAYTAAVGIAAGIAFGLAPALEATSLDLSHGIKQEGAAVSLRSRPRRITDLLVTSQVAASLILMVLAGLLIRNAQLVAGLNPGYDLDALVDLGFDGSKAKLIERLKRDPRVLAVSEVWRTPLYGNLRVLPALANGKAEPLGYSYVDHAYFATMGIPVVRGRTFIRQEMTPDARVAVISEATA